MHSAPQQVGILGATGYSGRELASLIGRHPGLEARPMSARAGADLSPQVLAELDGVFLCTPHGVGFDLARAALDAGCKVVDLSADFRLKDPAVFEATYGMPHPAPDLLDAAVYGLTEHRRQQVASARLVANPGCYPTSILLPYIPLARGGVLDEQSPIVADSKSGVSGAGKNPTPQTHYGSVHENFRAYGVGTHRHAPEIHQEAETSRIVFVPHLLPVFRGLLSTLYLTPKPGVDAAEVRELLEDSYKDEPFVRVCRESLPELSQVQHTNRCHIGVEDAYGQIVVVSVIDNLVKGAAGQALQNMNLMLGIEEGAGLS